METSLVITQPREGILTFSMQGLSFGVAGKELELSCSGVKGEELLRWIAEICMGGVPNYKELDGEVYTPLITFEYTPIICNGKAVYSHGGDVAIKVWFRGDKLTKHMTLAELNKAVETAMAL